MTMQLGDYKDLSQNLDLVMIQNSMALLHITKLKVMVNSSIAIHRLHGADSVTVIIMVLIIVILVDEDVNFVPLDVSKFEIEITVVPVLVATSIKQAPVLSKHFNVPPTDFTCK